MQENRVEAMELALEVGMVQYDFSLYTKFYLYACMLKVTASIGQFIK